MPTPAGGSGGALDATVEAVNGGPPPEDEEVARARLLLDEATAAVESVQGKVDKLTAHLAGAKESLKQAEAAKKAAVKHLQEVEGGGR